LPSALKKSPIIRDINDVEVLEKIFGVISNQIQIMALSLQKDINFPLEKNEILSFNFFSFVGN